MAQLLQQCHKRGIFLLCQMAGVACKKPRNLIFAKIHYKLHKLLCFCVNAHKIYQIRYMEVKYNKNDIIHYYVVCYRYLVLHLQCIYRARLCDKICFLCCLIQLKIFCKSNPANKLDLKSL